MRIKNELNKPNLVKCFGPRLRLWTWTLDFVTGPSFSMNKKIKWMKQIISIEHITQTAFLDQAKPNNKNTAVWFQTTIMCLLYSSLI